MIPPAWIRGLLAWLATYGLHSTLLLGATWLVCRMRAPRSVRARERAWRLALLGGLLTATLQVGLGARPWLGRIEWASTAAAEEPAAAEPDDAPQPSLPPLTAERPRRREFSHPAPFAARDSATAQHAEPIVQPLAAAPLAPPIATLDAACESVAAPAIDPVASERPEASTDTSAIAVPAETDPRPSLAEFAAPASVELIPAPEELPPRPLASAITSRLAKWPGAVLLGWIALGLVGFLGIVASWTCLWRSLLGRVPLVDGPLVAHLDALRQRAGIRRRVRLSTSTRLTSPVSMGILRAEICIPVAVLSQLSPAQQEALLAHELGHAVRRDPLWFGVYALVERVLFFQPLNRLARRQLQELAEIASDDWAVRWTGARIALASCLTEVAGWILRERPRAIVLPGLGGHRSRLGRRVERLLDDRRSPTAEPRAPWWPPVAGAALAAVTLAVPGVSATVRALGTDAEHIRDDQMPALAEPDAGSALLPPTIDELDGAAAPEVLPEETGTAPATDDVRAERVLLDDELSLLESEIAELRTELESRRLEERFAASMDAIEERLRGLRARQELARALLERWSTNTPP